MLEVIMIECLTIMGRVKPEAPKGAGHSAVPGRPEFRNSRSGLPSQQRESKMHELTAAQCYENALKCFQDNVLLLEKLDPKHTNDPVTWNLHFGLMRLAQGLLQDRTDRAR